MDKKNVTSKVSTFLVATLLLAGYPFSQAGAVFTGGNIGPSATSPSPSTSSTKPEEPSPSPSVGTSPTATDTTLPDKNVTVDEPSPIEKEDHGSSLGQTLWLVGGGAVLLVLLFGGSILIAKRKK